MLKKYDGYIVNAKIGLNHGQNVGCGFIKSFVGLS